MNTPLPVTIAASTHSSQKHYFPSCFYHILRTDHKIIIDRWGFLRYKHSMDKNLIKESITEILRKQDVKRPVCSDRSCAATFRRTAMSTYSSKFNDKYKQVTARPYRAQSLLEEKTKLRIDLLTYDSITRASGNQFCNTTSRCLDRSASIYIEHILQSIELLEDYISGVDERDFSSSVRVQDLVCPRLEIIGEAVKNIRLIFKTGILKLNGGISPDCAMCLYITTLRRRPVAVYGMS